MASLIDPTKPEDGVPAVKADLRANLQAAKDEIEALQAGGTALPAGGLTGQRLTKLSDSDFDVGWQTPSGAEASHFIYAKDHGAVADGQDRRAELLDAIAAARRKTLVIEGMISIGAEIRLTEADNGTTIIGAGPVGHGIRALDPDNFAQSQMLRVEGTDALTPITDMTFRSLEIDGNKAAASTASFACVAHRMARRIRWENCYVHSNPASGNVNMFRLSGSVVDAWLIGNRFWDTARNGIDLFAQTIGNGPNKRIFIIGNSIKGGPDALRNGILCSSDLTYIDDPTTAIIIGNEIFDFFQNAGIRLSGACHALISGNRFRNNLDNIRSVAPRSNWAVISDNVFVSTLNDAHDHIVLRTTGDSGSIGASFSMSGNLLQPTGGRGIGCVPDVDNGGDVSVTISNNELVGCPIEVSKFGGTGKALVKVSGNTVRGISAGDGISVSDVDRAIVTSNVVSGAGANGLNLSTLDKPIVAHNSIEGTWTTPIAQTTVTNAIGLDPQTNQV